MKMAKSPNVDIASGSSCSKSAFTKALKAVRRKVGHQDRPSSEFKRTKATKLSGSKGRKGKVYSRCSPGIISDVLLGMDEQRMKLLKEMGFDGFASMKIDKNNRQFGAWLLSRFDPITCFLHSGTKSQLKLTCQDINLVLGIPWEGKDIVPATQQEVITMKRYLCQVFEKESFDQITIQALSRILYRRSNGQMSPEEVVQFKTTFIIFLVTKFLAPVSLNNYISSRYMKTLIDIDNIHRYNWAKFVLDELKIAASSLHDKLQNLNGPGYVNGCIVLLQIFYLDNLEIGRDTPPHDCFPRIRAYNDKLIAEFIKKDMVIKDRFPFPAFGKLKLRDPLHVCYKNKTTGIPLQTRDAPGKEATPNPTKLLNCGVDPAITVVDLTTKDQVHDNLNTQLLEIVDHNSANTDKTPEAVIKELTPNPINLFSAGIDPPSFDLGLSQPDSQDTMMGNPEIQVNANLNAQFDEAAVLEVVPDTPPCHQGISKSGNKEKRAKFVSPHSILKEVSGVRITMREQYAVTNYPPKSKRRIIGEPADLLVDRPVRAIKPSNLVKSPFLCKQRSFMRNDNKAADDLFKYTTSIHDKDSLKMLWVHISNPVPRNLKLKDIQQALNFNQRMTEETFNVAVQALQEDELHRFGSTEFVGWRHFLNQDFAMYAIADNGHWDPDDHIHLFNDETLIPYNVSSCRLIFIPVQLVSHFALYAFDMEKKTITILDPVRDISLVGTDIPERHSNTKLRVSKALQDCLRLTLDNWNEDIPSWDVKYPTSLLAESNKVDSAFHVLYYMRNWDGTRLVNNVPMDSLNMRKEFLVNLLSFNTNEALLPEPVQRFLKAASRN